jgi:hypothetical protein
LSGAQRNRSRAIVTASWQKSQPHENKVNQQITWSSGAHVCTSRAQCPPADSFLYAFAIAIAIGGGAAGLMTLIKKELSSKAPRPKSLAAAEAKQSFDKVVRNLLFRWERVWCAG